MKDYNSNNSSQMNEELIKRYHEIYYDFNTEYKNISVCAFTMCNCVAAWKDVSGDGC
jgi:hypothetical protein